MNVTRWILQAAALLMVASAGSISLLQWAEFVLTQIFKEA